MCENGMGQTINKRRVLAVLVLATILTATQVIGMYISAKYHTSVHTSELWNKIATLPTIGYGVVAVLEYVFWVIGVYLLFCTLEKHRDKGDTAEEKQKIAHPKLMWCVFALALVVCWVPALLAAYPGFYNYDVTGQLAQVMFDTVSYSSHHPLLHTLIVGNIINFGFGLSGGAGLSAGVFLYSIFQMIFCAVFFAGFLCDIRRLTGRKWLVTVAFLYYAFFPTVVMFNMSTTKDVMCAVVLQYCVLRIFEGMRDSNGFWGDKARAVKLVLATALMCLLRNNGIYAVAAFVMVGVVLLRKENRRLLLLLVGSMVLYLLVNKGLLFALQAEKGGRVEAFSVPLQQVARVYGQYGQEAFTEEEWQLVMEVIPEYKLSGYNPVQADYIKNYTDFDRVLTNKGDYLKMWCRLGLRYPVAYVSSFLDNTYQAWYPGTSIIDKPLEGHIYYFDCKMGNELENESRIQWLYDFYREIGEEFSYQKLPVIRLLFSVGAMFWVALFTFFYGFWMQDRAIVWSLLLVLLFSVTCLLGPVVLVRYYLVLFYGFPVSIAFCLTKKTTQYNTQSD